MYLERIRIPSFRVLKNIDISFERGFFPKVFPIGSLNGGGKSTLLQLIFVLLHCSFDRDRVDFVRNLINTFKSNNVNTVLSIIDIWDGEKEIQLEFFYCQELYFRSLSENQIGLPNNDSYSSITKKIMVIPDEIVVLERRKTTIQDLLHKIESLIDNEKKGDNEGKSLNSRYITREVEHSLKEIKELLSLIFSDFSDIEPASYITKISGLLSILRYKKDWFSENEVILQVNQVYTDTLSIIDRLLRTKVLELETIEDYQKSYMKLLEDNKIVYICDISSNSKDDTDEKILVCRLKGNLDIKETNGFLKKMSEKVFFAAHVSQVFLFTLSDVRRLLFKTQDSKELNGYDEDYHTYIQKIKSKLPGFFTYDFLGIDILVNAFVKARDLDFQEAVKTNGEYGSNYKKLLNDLNSLLNNKKINIEENLLELTFQDIDNTKLNPEDLSHGELKRLCIYMWLKHNNIENAIVLMDEIEIAFHPDWQYEIVQDIQKWSSNNQYLLATHSFSICEAVTPAHVKELEPKLLNNKKND